ncbi:MAG: hypothetical protein PF961_22090 [Planctomycetota bacterium]|jgi:hypothetical protein|nr:hypothetical protein [Planctomycetota bacterium]
MPVDYHIDKELSTVFSKARDALNDSDVLEHQQLITNDPAFTPDLNQLFDLTEVTKVELTSNGTRLLASRDPFGAGAKRAFVVAPGAMEVFGMMRMFQIMTDEHDDELRVQFNHIGKARLWLGLPE